jgi:hypothetical protein
MTDHVLIEKSGGALTLTFNRPEKRAPDFPKVAG